MRVTIKEVAKEAGVSTSTVSRVLSNDKRISEDTKINVKEAVKKLNYRPNIVAQGLANKRTKILAVVIPHGAEELFSNPFFTQAMKGISICAEEENYYIMYAFKNEMDDELEWIKKFTESNLVDGLCLFNAKNNDLIINYLKYEKFPFVIIGRPEHIDDILWVDNDNFEAMYSLTQRLVDDGHTKIGFVGGKKDLNMSKDRVDGYKQGLFSRNIEVNNEIIVEMDHFNEEEGYIAAKRILKRECKVTAIITTDDLLAFGVQDALRTLRVNNIAVVGFNNTILSQYKTPPLASVHINPEKLGYYATKLLIDSLGGACKKKFYVVDTELVIRESMNVDINKYNVQPIA